MKLPVSQLLELAPYALQAGVLVVGWLISRRLKAPEQRARAEALARIANDTAAAVYAANPGASWAKLLEETVRELSAAAGLPTRNEGAIQRAAAGALARAQGFAFPEPRK